VQLSEMPLTSNGKVDKKSLLSMEVEGLVSGVEYPAPRSEMEIEMVRIWEDLLEQEKVGLRDDFFVLGGHSLKAIRLINEYHKLFDVRVELKDVFASSTIEGQSQLLASRVKKEYKDIVRLPVQDSYSISDAQRRLWVLSQFEDGSKAYHIPSHMSLKANASDISNLKLAIHCVIERHEILRTVFRENAEGEVRQWILTPETLDFKIEELDFSGYDDASSSSNALLDYISADNSKAFDLESGPLLRVSIIRLWDEHYVFYYNMHHIISDGWSMDVLSKEVLHYYECYKSDLPSALPALRIQYKDYASWQLGELSNSSSELDRLYWLDMLSGELPLLDLPGSGLRPRLKTYKGHSLGMYFSTDQTESIKSFSQERGGSLFMGLLSVWNILCYRYTGQTDIITGSPVAGRDHADLEDQIGFYVNTLALRTSINPDEDFNTFFEGLKERVLTSYSHQMYPFDRLVEELDLRRDTSRSAVFDVLFTLQNQRESSNGMVIPEDLPGRVLDQGDCLSKFDMNITFNEVGDRLYLGVTYNSDVYARDMVEGLLVHYGALMDALLSSPAEQLGSVDYLTDEDRYELLSTFNDTFFSYPKDKTIVSLFEDQVVRTPDAVAVVFEGVELTYRELNEQSNQLAHYLREQYVIEADDLIGIQLERSLDMIVSILGVLKSGGAYVPIDTEYPEDRISYILEDSNCTALLDTDKMSVFKAVAGHYKKENPQVLTSSNNLAYVIYTSGTTGSPKGVMIEHRNVVNLLSTQTKFYNIESDDNFLLFSSISFDASVEQLYLPLVNGAKLYVITTEKILNTSVFEAFLLENKIAHFQAVPSFFRTLSSRSLLGLKRIVSGGDIFDKNPFRELDRKISVINKYGPTEATVTSTGYLVRDFDVNSLSIGKPIGNTSIYILDSALHLCAKGVVGELCIGGDGLARGYLTRADLTCEKFVPN